jgi:hypothetical protein
VQRPAALLRDHMADRITRARNDTRIAITFMTCKVIDFEVSLGDS